MDIGGTWLIGPEEVAEQSDTQDKCLHSWVAGMMHVHDEDLETVARMRPVTCEKCDDTYQVSAVRSIPPADQVNPGRYKGKTAAQWRESAITEGLKWHNLCAEVAEHDGIMEFPALFTLTAALVPQAVWVKTKRGKWVWRIGSGSDVTWFDPSVATSGARRRANDAAKGYQVGSVRTRAQVANSSTINSQYHYIAQVDNTPIEIVDDGRLGTAYQDR